MVHYLIFFNATICIKLADFLYFEWIKEILLNKEDKHQRISIL